jgi:hypothetical protein
MASELRVTTIANNAGSESVNTTYVVNNIPKAYVNINGTGTIAIRSSNNAASITDNGTGNYTVTFTSAMNDAEYGANVTGATGDTNSVAIGGRYTTSTASACNFSNAVAGVGGSDVSYTHVCINGDLA